MSGGPTRYKIEIGIKLIPMNNAVVTRRRRAWKTGARTPQMSRSFTLKGWYLPSILRAEGTLLPERKGSVWDSRVEGRCGEVRLMKLTRCEVHKRAAPPTNLLIDVGVNINGI
jgi:hypothetical protein